MPLPTRSTAVHNRSRRIQLLTASSSAPSRSLDELHAEGKALRKACTRGSHRVWKPSRDRRDPIALLDQSSKGRIPDLIPIRYGRMMQSPFTFFRGAALNMAADLATTPVTGLRVQACGDCHLLNFGWFATPERRELFAINDLDETLPGPWEWDVKRLATSFVLACRSNGFSESCAQDAAQSCVRSYRTHMTAFSEMPVLDVWYAHVDFETLLPMIKDQQTRKRARKRLAKARDRSVLEHDFPKLTQAVAGKPQIKDHPPLIYHLDRDEAGLTNEVHEAFARYQETLEYDRRFLLDRYQLRDIAVKVVGVGSVGTRSGIMLLLASERDPLFLQVKEASASVLEQYAGKSIFSNHGQRVVNGSRLLQSASDLFLGWLVAPSGRHYYVRQLNDMKIKVLVELFNPGVMMQYAEVCGWILAKGPLDRASHPESADTWAKATASTKRSLISPSRMPTRVSAITTSSGRRCAKADSRFRRASSRVVRERCGSLAMAKRRARAAASRARQCRREFRPRTAG